MMNALHAFHLLISISIISKMGENPNTPLPYESQLESEKSRWNFPRLARSSGITPLSLVEKGENVRGR